MVMKLTKRHQQQLRTSLPILDGFVPRQDALGFRLCILANVLFTHSLIPSFTIITSFNLRNFS